MAQNIELDKLKLLGRIVVGVYFDDTCDEVLAVKVDPFCCDKSGRIINDPLLFQQADLKMVANAVAVAFEGVWRQTMPAQPESSSSPRIKPDRKNPGRSNGRH